MIEQLLPKDRAVDIKVSPEKLPQWAETLRAGGFSEKEITGIMLRMPVSTGKREKPRFIENVRPSAESVPDWMNALTEGGFTYKEVKEILERMTMDADEKAEILGKLKKVEVKNLDQQVEVPVKIIQ